MATYQITGPDGSVHEVTAPDSASQDDVMRYFKTQQSSAAAPAPDPSAGGSTLNLAGFDTGIKTPQWLDRGLTGMGKSVADTGRGIGQLFGAVPQSEVDAAAARDKPLMATGAGVAGNVVGQVAQMALPLSLAGKVSPALNVLARANPFATAALTAGTVGAAQPVTSDGTNALGFLPQSRIGNALGDAAGSVVGQGVAQGLGRVALGASDLISPTVKDLYAKAQAAGIPVTFSQLSDSKVVKAVQSALSKLPLSGAPPDPMPAFQRAVSKTFGEDSPVLNSDLYAAAKQRIGGNFEDLSARNTLNVTPQMANDLGAVSNNARLGTSDTQKSVAAAIDEIMSHADANGQIPGKAYQSFDSWLGKQMKNGGESASYLGDIQSAVRGAMDQSISPADQAAWQTARSQYAALKTVRDLISKDSGDGTISPALLMGRVTATNAGKERMAMGNGGALGDLAQIGKRFLADSSPDSGTGLRNLIYGAMTGGAGTAAQMLGASPTQMMLGAGALGTSALIGRGTNALMNSPGFANYMVNGAGPAVNALAYGSRAAPYLLPGVLNAGQQ